MIVLGEQIKKLREARNLSQVQLAKELNISKQSVSNWENENILPSIEMLMALSNYFSVSTDFLLGLDHRQFIEVSGLTTEEIAHIQVLIQDLLSKNQTY